MKQNDFYEVDGCTDFIPVKLIEEHKHMMNTLELEVAESGFRTFAPNMYKFPKVDEPQKVTVPKFVAEWIKKYKEDGSRLCHALEDVFDDVELSLYIKQQEDDYTETIAEAWIAYPNITVEQEKLYTVKVLDSTLFKMTSDNHVRYKLIGENAIPLESKIGNYTFEVNLTEKEIKGADERLWQFAEEVEE